MKEGALREDQVAIASDFGIGFGSGDRGTGCVSYVIFISCIASWGILNAKSNMDFFYFHLTRHDDGSHHWILPWI